MAAQPGGSNSVSRTTAAHKRASAMASSLVTLACVTTANAAPTPFFAPQIINSNFNKQTVLHAALAW
jgi:hypothetical protein